MKTIPVAKPHLGRLELVNVQRAVRSGWISSQGAYVEQFERGFAKYCRRRYGVAVSNGTVALHLALVALGIGNGDSVAVPSLTFIATANAANYVGSRVVFADSDSQTWCMDPRSFRHWRKVSAVIPVHLYGHPADMDSILEVARKYDFPVVEDAAEAHGARYKGRMVGSFGEISCFSFYGNKILTTGEGGMCLTDDEELAFKMRLLRDHGMDRRSKYIHPYVGYNYRMTNIQAAIGVAQLSRISELVSRRRKIAKTYVDLLNRDALTLPAEAEWASSVCWLFSLLVKGFNFEKRDKLIRKMRSRGIETRPFFYPNNLQPPYINTHQTCPIAERISAEGISLPTYHDISEKEIARVASVLLECLGLT